MFLMIAVTTKEEPIEYDRVVRCPHCDDMGSYNIFIEKLINGGLRNVEYSIF